MIHVRRIGLDFHLLISLSQLFALPPTKMITRTLPLLFVIFRDLEDDPIFLLPRCIEFMKKLPCLFSLVCVWVGRREGKY